MLGLQMAPSFLRAAAVTTLVESKGKTPVIVSGRGEGSAKISALPTSWGRVKVTVLVSFPPPQIQFARQLIGMNFPGMLRSLGLLSSLNNDP